MPGPGTTVIAEQNSWYKQSECEITILVKEAPKSSNLGASAKIIDYSGEMI
jgi:hypothetical protein